MFTVSALLLDDALLKCVAIQKSRSTGGAKCIVAYTQTKFWLGNPAAFPWHLNKNTS